jgi:cobalt-zinc-cadmium resistance protein CzcA
VSWLERPRSREHRGGSPPDPDQPVEAAGRLFLRPRRQGREPARASRALTMAIGAALFGVFVLLLIALGSAVEAAMILGTVPIAFVGGILALLIAGETWNVSSLVGLIGLFGIAVQNSLVLVTQTGGLVSEGRTLAEAVREASIGRVRPKLMTAGTATLGLLPLLVLQLHGTEIERPLAIVMRR